MRECLEVTGKTVEEAVNQALTTWGVTREEVEIIVMEEPSKGFLGFGARDAMVKVFRKEEDASGETVTAKPVEEVSPGVAIFNDVPAQPESASPEVVSLTETKPLSLDHTESVTSAKQVTKEPSSAQTDESVATNRRRSGRDAFVSEEEQEEAARRGKEFLQQVTDAMGLSVMIEKMVSPDMIRLHLHGEDLGLLIGKRGTTLDALQYLTNLAANVDVRGRYFIMLDVENYRSRREETLVALARRMAAKVKKNRRKVVLEPMNAYERKIIHTALQDDPQVYTLSEGEYQDRHLVIHYQE